MRPDCLILVDYPGFNLKVAETAHDLGVKVYYYISPKVWAWKEWRVSTIRRVVDRLFVIFPFEVSYYKNRHQMDVTYVGNPSVSEIDEALAEAPDFHTFCSQHRLREKPVIALLPGSRLGEIRNNLPVMVKAAARFVQYQPVIGGAPSVPLSFYSTYTDAPVIHSGTIDLLRNARAALVTSGTATLEAALAGTPQVACYRANGMKISYDIMRKLLSVDYVTLPNLILGREAIPEKLVHLCTPDTVAESLSPLTSLTSPARQKMLADYAEMRLRLGEKDAAANVADCIIAELRGAAVTPAR